MATKTNELDLELQEHEGIGRLSYRFDLGRRDFFKLMGAGVLVFLAASPASAQESGKADDETVPETISAWMHISEDGKVSVYTGKAEMGQNIRTSLTQQVAEELEVPMSTIKLVMGDTALTPFDIGTFGSRTTPTMGPRLRKAAASMREILLGMAAKRLLVDRSTLVAADGKIHHPGSGRSLSYAELSRGQRFATVIEDAPLTPASRWHVAGCPEPKVEGRAFVTGQHKYTPDLKQPGMMYGKVLRPPAFRATLVSLDSRQAEKMPGVKVIRDGALVGVVAPDEFVASRALDALDAKWDSP